MGDMSETCKRCAFQPLVTLWVALFLDCLRPTIGGQVEEGHSSCTDHAQQPESVLLQLKSATTAAQSLAASSALWELEQQSKFIFSQDFEGMEDGDSWCWYSKAWCDYLRIHDIDAGNSQRSLRVAYHPTDRGSDRLQQKRALPAGLKQATLSFAVYFESDFEWVRGGKLGFGLFGGQATTGCKAVVADGWSNRLMWKPDGQLVVYLYHQKRAERCGDYVYAMVGGEKFHFELERWYNLSISMHLNDPPTEANGDVSLYIDGVRAVYVADLQWRAADGAFIDTMGLSTFYGGSSASWAPSKTTHVCYDDILVTTNSDEGTPVPATESALTPSPTRASPTGVQPVSAPTPPMTPLPTRLKTSSEGQRLCAEKWKQCGGKKWEGQTCCADGLVCVKKNEYYSQCRSE